MSGNHFGLADILPPADTSSAGVSFAVSDSDARKISALHLKATEALRGAKDKLHRSESDTRGGNDERAGNSAREAERFISEAGRVLGSLNATLERAKPKYPRLENSEEDIKDLVRMYRSELARVRSEMKSALDHISTMKREKKPDDRILIGTKALWALDRARKILFLPNVQSVGTGMSAADTSSGGVSFAVPGPNDPRMIKRWKEAAKNPGRFRREEILDLLQWNDPNGEYTDQHARASGEKPFTLAEARQILREQIRDGGMSAADTSSAGVAFGNLSDLGGQATDGEARNIKALSDLFWRHMQSTARNIWYARRDLSDPEKDPKPGIQNAKNSAAAADRALEGLLFYVKKLKDSKPKDRILSDIKGVRSGLDTIIAKIKRGSDSSGSSKPLMGEALKEATKILRGSPGGVPSFLSAAAGRDSAMLGNHFGLEDLMSAGGDSVTFAKRLSGDDPAVKEFMKTAGVKWYRHLKDLSDELNRAFSEVRHVLPQKWIAPVRKEIQNLRGHVGESMKELPKDLRSDPGDPDIGLGEVGLIDIIFGRLTEIDSKISASGWDVPFAGDLAKKVRDKWKAPAQEFHRAHQSLLRSSMSAGGDPVEFAVQGKMLIRRISKAKAAADEAVRDLSALMVVLEKGKTRSDPEQSLDLGSYGRRKDQILRRLSAIERAISFDPER